MNKDTYKIGIDARFYGPEQKGLGRYTQEIVDRIVNLDRENEYVIFLSEVNFDKFNCENNKVTKKLVKAKWYTLAEQIIFPVIIWREKLDLMHFMHFNVPVLTPTRFVVTIHDLILTKFPSIRATTLSPWLYKIKNLFYKIIIWFAAKRSEYIIAISKNTKTDIIKQFKVEPEKIRVVYEGVVGLERRGENKLSSREVLDKYDIKKPFLLYVGNAYPHKNLEILIKSFLEIKKEYSDFNLVLVGKEDYFYKRLKDYVELNNYPVVFAGFVPDEELKHLFKQASCYVFPSLYEGFGLPPLEAMAEGCPVISSDKSCMPEVLEEAAIYFDPSNKKDIIEKIEQVIKDKNLKEKLIKKGHIQYKKYSWDKATKETLDIYNKILN